MTPLWTPSPDRAAATHLAAFARAAATAAGRPLDDYWALHAWSVAEPDAFWRTCLRESGLPHRGHSDAAHDGAPMPATAWFADVTLNYAEALLAGRGTAADAPAIIATTEAAEDRVISRGELRLSVGRAAAALARDGVGAGDTVAAFVANVPEAVILHLACAARGAIFSSCSPDFGADAAYARFHQIAPKLLLASASYPYNGKRFDTGTVVTDLIGRLPGSPRLVLLGGAIGGVDSIAWADWLPAAWSPLVPIQLPFDHPLAVLYSSGTTGLPKALVHRAGGVLLTHHKELRLHGDVGPGDRLLYFTTCGWMMWNWLVSALAEGATIVLYDGSPSHPTLDVLWDAVDRLDVTHFGTSARFIHGCRAADLVPKQAQRLERLRTVFSTGSPLARTGFEWVYRDVKADVHLASISGGTDIVGCFMLGVPTEPVYAGEIQGPGLGVDLAAFDEDGQPVDGRPGELVCRQPLPSMPLRFWGDADGSRYHAAYFERFPGVWRHGDLIEITPRHGIVVYGRSDATLNPGGVRIGTAEIYRPLETMPEIVEGLAVGKREGDDDVIWLFVVLRAGSTLDDALVARIQRTIRTEESPRHVPKRILQISELPRTRSGKSMEIAVTQLINGRPVPNRMVVANPRSLDEIEAAVARGDA
ncbi:MAG: acetoacetate--CoA ligase [Vicinamibacteraceae bacterium]